MNAANLGYGAFKIAVNLARLACNNSWIPSYHTTICANTRKLIGVLDKIAAATA